MKLSGKIALVTGAGRGIGRGCALELARGGADVVLNDRPGGEDVSIVLAEIQALGRQCHVVESDVFSRSGCEYLVEQTLRQVPRIDILVSNPAFSRRCAFLDYSPDIFEQTIAGTLVSGFHLSQLVARHMVASDVAGRIVFISSVQAEMPIALCAAYGAAKAGLNHMGRSIAVELAPHRINVNVIEPGWTDTPGEHATFGSDRVAEAGRQLPLGRMGTPEDIGRAATFLCSDDADYITGSVLAVDGLFRYKDCMVQHLDSVQDAD
ncbi:MAG: SDR family oxidoreductase [Fuerstiella sp.]|nr:SDR family oxidoreductase [Fuerstiella sp.]MDG2130527.1 SDR family NAD(P)-dependent oxidoreductase [Fuerstiella sp.]